MIGETANRVEPCVVKRRSIRLVSRQIVDDYDVHDDVHEDYFHEDDQDHGEVHHDVDHVGSGCGKWNPRMSRLVDSLVFAVFVVVVVVANHLAIVAVVAVLVTATAMVVEVVDRSEETSDAEKSSLEPSSLL